MLKDLLKEGGLYTLANLLTKGISLLLIPFYTAYFTPSDYGLYDILSVFGVFAGNIFSLQLNQGLARFVAEPTKTEKEKIEYASTATISYIFSLILFLIISFAFSSYFTSILSPNSKLRLNTFYLAVISIFITNIFYFFNVYLRFIRQVKMVALLSFIQTIFGILLLMYFVFNLDYGINSFFIPYIIVTPPLIIFQLYLLRDRLKLYFNKSIYKELLKYSAPLIGSSIALIVMNLTDRLFINELLGENELGIYGIGLKFASIIGIVIAGFSTALGPLIYEKHNKKNTQEELGNLFNLFIGIGVGGTLLLALFSIDIVNFFTTFSYHKAGTVLPIMLFTTLFTGFLMFSPGLQIKKKTSIITILTIIFAILNIILNYFLIPKYGLKGAAVSTLIATTLYAVTYFIVSKKVYPIQVNVLKVLIPFIYVILVLYFNYKLDFNNIIFKFFSILLYLILIYKIGLLKRLESKFKWRK
jgi:O-antigen/teichoic acid export membrane protein